MQYDKGFYPEPGAANDQPAKFPELMISFHAMLRDVEEEAEKRKPKKAPRPKPARPQPARG